MVKEWLTADQLSKVSHRIRTPILSIHQLVAIKKIHNYFHTWQGLTLEETELNFMRDQNPDNEINIWNQMIDRHQTAVASGMDPKTAFFAVVEWSLNQYPMTVESVPESPPSIDDGNYRIDGFKGR
jgi:hypothetical protein